MEKERVLKLYKEYLQNNPQIAYIRNIRRNYRRLIDSMYLRNNEVLKDEKLSGNLTSEQLRKLDDRYNNKLKWDIIESDVTEEQITKFEQGNGIMLPKQFREYIQGYSFLHSNFYPKCAVSEDYGYCGYYNQKTGEYLRYSDKDLEQNEELIGNVKIEFFGVSNPNDTLLLGYFENIRMFQLGNLDSGDMMLLDCETGEVQSWDHELLYFAEVAKSKEEFKEKCWEGDFWFKDFDTFLEWVFEKTVYNFEEAEDKEGF